MFFERDVEAVVGAGGIVLPKVDGPADVDAASGRLDRAGSNARLELLIESASGVTQLTAIASASSGATATARPPSSRRSRVRTQIG